METIWTHFKDFYKSLNDVLVMHDTRSKCCSICWHFIIGFKTFCWTLLSFRLLGYSNQIVFDLVNTRITHIHKQKSILDLVSTNTPPQ